MVKERYEIGKGALVNIDDCLGDLQIRGWAEQAVAVMGEHEAEQTELGISLRSQGSLKIYVPPQGSVRVNSAKGDVAIRGVDGDLQAEEVSGDLVVKRTAKALIGTVHGDMVVSNVDGLVKADSILGDAVLRSIGQAEVGMAHGDLVLRYAAGSVAIDQVMGDANLNTVSGFVTIGMGQRDVNLGNLGGALNVALAQGDVRLRGGLRAGKHHITAKGDIVVRWPATEPLQVLATAPQVKSRLDFEDTTEEEGTFSGRLGDGETILVLEAGGRIILKEVDAVDWEFEFEGDWAAGGAEFARLDEHLSNIGAHVSEVSRKIEEQLGPDFAQRMADKAVRKTEQAMERAVREVERARRRAERWTPPPPPSAAKTKKRTSVSSDEQMKILGMLENGIISVQEAETLLKALEE